MAGDYSELNMEHRSDGISAHPASQHVSVENRQAWSQSAFTNLIALLCHPAGAGKDTLFLKLPQAKTSQLILFS